MHGGALLAVTVELTCAQKKPSPLAAVEPAPVFPLKRAFMHRARLLLSAIIVAASTIALPLKARAQVITGMSGPNITVNTPDYSFDPDNWVRAFDFTATGFHVGFNSFAAFDQGQTATFDFTLAGASSLDGVNFSGCLIGGGGGQSDNSLCGTYADGFVTYSSLGANQNAGSGAYWQYVNSMFTAKLYGTTLELTAKNPESSVGFQPLDVYFEMTQPPTTVPEPATVSLMAAGLLVLGAAARRTRRA
jgi:hypothetical protein